MDYTYKDLLHEAYKEALLSPDPSTQNGAVLFEIDELGEIVYHSVRDHNKFPKGVEYKEERWERPLKYKVIEHAERNVIYKAARHGYRTSGLSMACPWAACSNCARAIIQAGLDSLVTHKQAFDRSPDFWKQEIEIAMTMFKEAGVEVIFYDGEIGLKEEILHSGKKWNP